MSASGRISNQFVDYLRACMPPVTYYYYEDYCAPDVVDRAICLAVENWNREINMLAPLHVWEQARREHQDNCVDCCPSRKETT